jgi:hypothetical protein
MGLALQSLVRLVVELIFHWVLHFHESYVTIPLFAYLLYKDGQYNLQIAAICKLDCNTSYYMTAASLFYTILICGDPAESWEVRMQGWCRVCKNHLKPFPFAGKFGGCRKSGEAVRAAGG